MQKLSVDIGDTFLGAGHKLQNPGNISKYVSAIIGGAISLAGIVFLFLLIAGGFSMIMGAGKSDPQSLEKGKKAVISALIGFIVVISAYWIVKLIESITGLVLIGA